MLDIMESCLITLSMPAFRLHVISALAYSDTARSWYGEIGDFCDHTARNGQSIGKTWKVGSLLTVRRCLLKADGLPLVHMAQLIVQA